MPHFLPFRGLRYRGLTDLGARVAPPYDVIHDDEREVLAARDPHNAVRLILPERSATEDAYATAARLLRTWREDGILRPDEIAAYYGYRMSFTDSHGANRVTHGVVGALSLPPGGPGTGDILPHERTIPKHRSDRLALLEATRANLDPIWGLTPASGLAEAAGAPGPDRQWATDDAGVHHELWSITDARSVAAIHEIVAGAPIVLADGHHRFETACAHHASHPDSPGTDAIMALVVELSETELQVEPIHRLLRGASDLRARLAPAFRVEALPSNGRADVEALEAAMASTKALGIVDRDGLAIAVPNAEALEDHLGADPTMRDVDAAIFEAMVAPLVHDADLEYRHDASTLAEIVAGGAADVAVLLRPVTVGQIREASYAGIRMPQKTTFFAPKPRTGLVFRSLEE